MADFDPIEDDLDPLAVTPMPSLCGQMESTWEHGELIGTRRCEGEVLRGRDGIYRCQRCGAGYGRG